RTNLSRNGRAGAQTKAANLARRNVNIVGARKVVIIGTAQKAETIGQNFERPLAVEQTVHFDPLFENLEYKILLLHGGGVFDVILAGLLNEFGHAHALQ